MDQDSAKEGTGGDRRNWRERLGVGQDLPRISDEFRTEDAESPPADGESQSSQQNGQHHGPKPGAPVARPAPMAPRYARPAAQRPANGSSSEADAQAPKPAQTVRISPVPPGLRPWAATAQPARPAAEAPRHQRQAGEPGADHPRPSAAGPQRPAHGPQRPPVGGQRPAPSRGPAAYPQATSRLGTALSAGGESFGERLRAQREAAERLAQQRLAAARERSGHAGADALSMLSPRRAEAAAQDKPAPQRGPGPQHKPAAGDQPRFTFAQEEIVAAQQETTFAPEAPAPAASHQEHAAPARPAAEPAPHVASDHAAAAPAYAQEYRHEDEGMFEDEQPGLHIAPQRASAADYSAAYREFEEEFEDEPRRGRGPLLLLLSLAGVAVVSGGLIYWYQQGDDSPAAEAGNVPVIAAPQEPVKAEVVPQEQPQQAAEPATRKQIYDRIIGEETLEPERLVPTEEEPQLRQAEQPVQPEQQLPAVPVESQADDPAADQQDPTESQPLPVPPPPGTGQQGDLLVPGMASNQVASAEPEPAELTLPAPRASSASLRRDEESSRVTAIEPASDDPRTNLEPVEAAELRDTTVPDSQAPVRASIYPEPEEPLAYPGTTAESPPPHDLVGEPEERRVAALPEPAPETAPAAVPSPEPAAEAEAAPKPEQALDVPLPKAKPQPPVRAAAKQATEPQPQKQAEAQPSSSGPVQIIPTDLGSGATQAPSVRAAQQPEAQTPQRRRTIGREPEYQFDQGAAYTGFSTGSDVAEAQQAEPPAPQQIASLEPDVATEQTASGGGYLVQLASFRSESDALKEYGELVQRHPQLVGNLDSRVQKASLGQSGAFYRLGIGPLADRDDATQLCNALIAAGEKDCLVRRN